MSGATGAIWFRDEYTPQSPHHFDDFVEEVKLAKQRNLKVLDIIMPINSDFDYKGPPQNAGSDFCKHCGWAQGSRKLSHINLDKFGDRLRDELGILKAQNLSIHAFEIGNEFDSYCFNGDVPNGHEASAAELDIAVHAYGEFLRRAPNMISESIKKLLQENARILGKDKPFWITEWGFLDQNAFPNAKGQTLGMAFDEFLTAFTDISLEIQIGPIMFNRYDVWLTDSSGKLLPHAQSLILYVSKQHRIPMNSRNLYQQP